MCFLGACEIFALCETLAWYHTFLRQKIFGVHPSGTPHIRKNAKWPKFTLKIRHFECFFAKFQYFAGSVCASWVRANFLLLVRHLYGTRPSSDKKYLACTHQAHPKPPIYWKITQFWPKSPRKCALWVRAKNFSASKRKTIHCAHLVWNNHDRIKIAENRYFWESFGLCTIKKFHMIS